MFKLSDITEEQARSILEQTNHDLIQENLNELGAIEISYVALSNKVFVVDCIQQDLSTLFSQDKSLRINFLKKRWLLAGGKIESFNSVTDLIDSCFMLKNSNFVTPPEDEQNMEEDVIEKPFGMRSSNPEIEASIVAITNQLKSNDESLTIEALQKTISHTISIFHVNYYDLLDAISALIEQLEEPESDTNKAALRSTMWKKNIRPAIPDKLFNQIGMIKDQIRRNDEDMKLALNNISECLAKILHKPVDYYQDISSKIERNWRFIDNYIRDIVSSVKRLIDHCKSKLGQPLSPRRDLQDVHNSLMQTISASNPEAARRLANEVEKANNFPSLRPS